MRPVSEGNDHRMSTPPDTIGQRYELGALLGRGGMGEVRAATDRRLGRAVAVKVLRSDLAEQDNLRGRFEREARAAARINHPNVVAIYDIGEDDGVPFIVMERLPGNSLARELASGRLSQDRACSLGLEILSALGAAHHLGVIHRDIKPSNILLDAESHAKVADFGIAKLAEEDSNTTMGIVFGTASYLAPERLAETYLQVGDKEKAFLWLEKVFDAHDISIVQFKVDPAYDILRDDPRYDQLLSRIGQKR